MLACLILATPPVVWYGPVTVHFNIQVAGNPYDPERNDLRVRFMPEKGKAEERIAHINSDGTIQASLVTLNPGRFRAVLVRNGKDLLEEPLEGIFDISRRAANGFARVDAEYPGRFRWDNGARFLPLGVSFSSTVSGERLAQVLATGANWVRFGIDPWRPTFNPAELSSKSLAELDGLIQVAELNGSTVQLSLFDPRPLESGTHPWMKANSGFLESPADFFTSAEAKRRFKMWLRHASARYGHSTSLFAWELLSHPAPFASPETVSAWQTEMAAYLRSVDPYSHLVTSAVAFPSINYQSEVFRMDAPAADLLPNLLNRAGGVGVLPAEGFEPHLRAAATVMRESGLAEQPIAQPLQLRASGADVKLEGLGTSEWALIRLTGNPKEVSIGGLSLADGEYRVTEVDLSTSATQNFDQRVSDFTAAQLTPSAPDVALIFKRKG